MNGMERGKNLITILERKGAISKMGFWKPAGNGKTEALTTAQRDQEVQGWKKGGSYHCGTCTPPKYIVIGDHAEVYMDSYMKDDFTWVYTDWVLPRNARGVEIYCADMPSVCVDISVYMQHSRCLQRILHEDAVGNTAEGGVCAGLLYRWNKMAIGQIRKEMKEAF